MGNRIEKNGISKEVKVLKQSSISISPMSLIDELRTEQTSMIIDSELDNSAISQESDSKYSTVSMDMTLARSASESSPGIEKKFVTFSDSGEMDVTKAFMNPSENISTTNDYNNLEKLSQLEQKVEELIMENSSLKEKNKDLIDEGKYQEIQDLKVKVK